MGVHHLEIYRVKNGYMVWTVDLDNLPALSDQYVAPTGEDCRQLIEQLLPLEKAETANHFCSFPTSGWGDDAGHQEVLTYCCKPTNGTNRCAEHQGM